TSHDLRPAIGNIIYCGELLKHAHRVVAAKHRHRAGKPNFVCDSSNGSEGYRRRAYGIIRTVMLAYGKDIQPYFIGQFCFCQKVLKALLKSDIAAVSESGKA